MRMPENEECCKVQKSTSEQKSNWSREPWVSERVDTGSVDMGDIYTTDIHYMFSRYDSLNQASTLLYPYPLGLLIAAPSDCCSNMFLVIASINISAF